MPSIITESSGFRELPMFVPFYIRLYIEKDTILLRFCSVQDAIFSFSGKGVYSTEKQNEMELLWI